MRTKKKIQPLYASNTLVKEIYLLEKKIEAMGDNISDWREEYYCEHPAGERDALLASIKKGNHDIEKWTKKLKSTETKIAKLYGKESFHEIDLLFRYKNFGGLKYTEKRKIRLN